MSTILECAFCTNEAMDRIYCESGHFARSEDPSLFCLDSGNEVAPLFVCMQHKAIFFATCGTMRPPGTMPCNALIALYDANPHIKDYEAMISDQSGVRSHHRGQRTVENQCVAIRKHGKLWTSLATKTQRGWGFSVAMIIDNDNKRLIHELRYLNDLVPRDERRDAPVRSPSLEPEVVQHSDNVKG